MLSVLAGSMEPPPPHLPLSTASPPSPSAAASAASSPTRLSVDLSGGSAARKRKFQPITDATSAAALAIAAGSIGSLLSLPVAAADSSWAGDAPPLPSSNPSLSAAVRSSTASTASSTPSPRPRSASSLYSPSHRHHAHGYESAEAAATFIAETAAGSHLAAQSQSRPTSQPLPAALTSISTTASTTAAAAQTYLPPTAAALVGYHASPLSQPPNPSMPWSMAAPSTTFSGSPTLTARLLPASTPASTHTSPRSSLSAQQPFAFAQPLSPPPAPPGVPPSSITTLMPIMPYTRIEPSVDQHFVVDDGDTLLGRYRVVRLLGRGTFSQVVQCRDLQAEEQCQVQEDASRVAASGKRTTDVAIKIVRAVEHYRVAAEREARLLQSIEHTRRSLSATAALPYLTDGCVSLLGSFMLGGHLCLVFPVLGLSLYDFLRLNRFRPLFPAHIRHIGYQLLQTCAFLHDECGIIHADIKPENVLLVDSSYQTIHISDMAINVPLSTTVRLIDFGTAVQSSADRPALVVSRSYRSLEVVLGVGWGEGVDVWAVGCVLMELYTGQRLFNIGQGGDDAHIQQMQQLLGPVPHSLLALPRVYPAPSPPSAVGSPVASSGSSGVLMGGSRLRDRVVAGDVKFCDLIERMLAFDPRRRITARQALQHPYFLDAD